MGYADGIKGYHLWDPTTHKVVVSRDVIFTENEMQGEQENDGTIKETTIIQIDEKSGEDNSSEAKLEHENKD